MLSDCKKNNQSEKCNYSIFNKIEEENPFIIETMYRFELLRSLISG